LNGDDGEYSGGRLSQHGCSLGLAAASQTVNQTESEEEVEANDVYHPLNASPSG